MKMSKVSNKNSCPRVINAAKIASYGFTIVELLVVIVVIGILASITIVSYSGIVNRTKIVTLQSDLSSAAKELKIFNVNNGYYPTTISTNCATTPTTDTNLCLKASPGSDYVSTPYLRTTEQSFRLTATNGSLIYSITDNSIPTEGIISIFNPADWIVIGAQTWAKANLNVGNMITGVTAQTNNSILEKYCYGDDDLNCTTYGALYQWNEAMQYSLVEGSQGICPVGSHIPSDNDWKILSMQLGMTQVQADSIGWPVTGVGAKLKIGGSSGLNFPLAGIRNNSGVFSSLLTAADVSTSTKIGSNEPWARDLHSTTADVGRGGLVYYGTYGISVRCLAN